MARILTRFVAAVVLGFAAGGALLAISQGRVSGIVRDENGTPVVGVRIVVTLEGVESFRLEETTNGNGEYWITLLDATRTYTYTLEKEGYQTLSETFKVGIGESNRHDFEMLTLDEARRRGPAGRELTAAERAVLIFNEGAEASQMGDSSTARAKFEEAVSIDPTLAAAHTALATIHFTEGDYAKAAEVAERARALDPEDAKALRILAESYSKLGREDEARAAAEALAVVDPSSQAYDLYKQAVSAYNAGDTAACLELADRALAIDPQLAGSHFMAGMCGIAADPIAAREHLERFLELAPESPDAATAREMLDYLK